ncbi:hypothetical protein [uncultured Croceitalea sp.]|uniref:hypothetical protein n=1 Tax=uncultured Croceitalea sp. TaxID=1798908 RepID=UPI00374F3A91
MWTNQNRIGATDASSTECHNKGDLKMTTKTQPEKKGDKPTHFLKIKTEQFGNPLNFTLAALWEDNEKDYMGVSLNGLKIRPNVNTGADLPTFQILLDTKIHGQDVEVQVGEILEDLKVSFGDMVIFPNNYEEKNKTNSNKKRLQP